MYLLQPTKAPPPAGQQPRDPLPIRGNMEGAEMQLRMSGPLPPQAKAEWALPTETPGYSDEGRAGGRPPALPEIMYWPLQKTTLIALRSESRSTGPLSDGAQTSRPGPIRKPGMVA